MREVHVPARSATSSAAAPAVLPIGKRVLELMAVAYRARRPVLLEGPTGVGKSEIVAQFAARETMDCRVLDLSLLEPPDLIGLPVIEDGRTRYAYPSELPTAGAGVLLLEELNRAEIPVMHPALQLLSARRLHSYELPRDWICVAAINPEHDDYQVNRLDPALRSRFLQVGVQAAHEDWLTWAGRERVHPLVLDLVRAEPTVFETSAPRSWKYLSDILHELKPSELASRELLLTVAQGYLPVAWAMALVESAEGFVPLPTLDLDALASRDGPRHFASVVDPLLRCGRTDAVVRLAGEACRLAGTADGGGVDWEGVFATLPGDLRRRFLLRVRHNGSVAAEGDA